MSSPTPIGGIVKIGRNMQRNNDISVNSNLNSVNVNDREIPTLCNNRIDGERWLTTIEAADYLRVTPANLRVMIYRGVLTPYKLNNRNRFKRSELDDLIESSVNKGGKS